MDYDKDKYYVEDSDRLTEAEKVQFAKDLLELERQSVIEFRDGRWQLAAGVEAGDTSEDRGARSAIKKEDGGN